MPSRRWTVAVVFAAALIAALRKENDNRFSSVHHETNTLQVTSADLRARCDDFETETRITREHVEALLRNSEARSHSLEERLDSVQNELTALRRTQYRDIDGLHRDILQPSVQVNARGGVGSGVILHSRPGETYVVTAHHVIQKAAREIEGREVFDPVDVRFYGTDGNEEESRIGEIVLQDRRQDLALLRIPSAGLLPPMARLASRERIRQLRIFTPVYAVGCPLGHAPLPSPGEISALRKEVDGAQFWMMSAPTIFGNSGGGIFHRETRELVGISAMICTYDGEGSTPIPHLGIMVPLDILYDWLDRNFYHFLYDPAHSPEECALAREEARRKNEVPPSPAGGTARTAADR